MPVNNKLYKILGVSDATEKEITKSYRKLAMKWHPDRIIQKKRKKNLRNSEAYSI